MSRCKAGIDAPLTEGEAATITRPLVRSADSPERPARPPIALRRRGDRDRPRPGPCLRDGREGRLLRLGGRGRAWPRHNPHPPHRHPRDASLLRTQGAGPGTPRALPQRPRHRDRAGRQMGDHPAGLRPRRASCPAWPTLPKTRSQWRKCCCTPPTSGAATQSPGSIVPALCKPPFWPPASPAPATATCRKAIGQPIPNAAPLQRGDLIFWKGHVALLTSPDQIIHANGKTMSVAYEGLPDAITRIEAQGEGPVIARRRPQG